VSDFEIQHLTALQIHNIDTILQLLPEPNTAEDCRSLLTVLEAVRMFYINQLECLRMEERRE
jgi:hypothetical protein